MAAVQERSLYTSACTLAAWLFLSQLPEAYSLVFKDVSSELFPHNTSKMGKIVAFSNLNDDRNTDILCVNGKQRCLWWKLDSRSRRESHLG